MRVRYVHTCSPGVTAAEKWCARYIHTRAHARQRRSARESGSEKVRRRAAPPEGKEEDRRLSREVKDRIHGVNNDGL